MYKLKIISILTIIAGIPALEGLWLMGQSGSFPLAAKIIVINAVVFRGFCGIMGGILFWRSTL